MCAWRGRAGVCYAQHLYHLYYLLCIYSLQSPEQSILSTLLSSLLSMCGQVHAIIPTTYVSRISIRAEMIKCQLFKLLKYFRKYAQSGSWFYDFLMSCDQKGFVSWSCEIVLTLALATVFHIILLTIFDKLLIGPSILVGKSFEITKLGLYYMILARDFVASGNAWLNQENYLYWWSYTITTFSIILIRLSSRPGKLDTRVGG